MTQSGVYGITINNGGNKHIVQILHEIRDINFIFKGSFISILPKPVEITQ